MHDPYPEQGETLVKGCSGIQNCVVWLRKTGQGREKVCTKIQGSKEGEMWVVRSHQLWTQGVKESSVENEKPGTAWNRAGKWMLVWRTVSAGCWKSAQHPPGGHWDILVGTAVLLPAVRAP